VVRKTKDKETKNTRNRKLKVQTGYWILIHIYIVSCLVTNTNHLVYNKMLIPKNKINYV